jgi:hypothetical protein
VKHVWNIITIIGLCYALWFYGMIAGKIEVLVNAAPDQEYMLAFSTPKKPLVVFGVAQAGLNKSQDEAAEVQMNRVFQEHGVPVIVKARKLIDIGNYK